MHRSERPRWRRPRGDGLEAGLIDDVMPADVGNPEGYFELLSIVRANDDLLAHFGDAGQSAELRVRLGRGRRGD